MVDGLALSKVGSFRQGQSQVPTTRRGDGALWLVGRTVTFEMGTDGQVAGKKSERHGNVLYLLGTLIKQISRSSREEALAPV